MSPFAPSLSSEIEKSLQVPKANPWRDEYWHSGFASQAFLQLRIETVDPGSCSIIKATGTWLVAGVTQSLRAVDAERSNTKESFSWH